MKRDHKIWILRLVLPLIILLTTFSLSYSAPSIDSPTLDPGVIRVGVPTQVSVTVKITDPTLIPSSVNLQQLDQNNNVIGVLGNLNPVGNNIFSITKTFNESTEKSIYLRVSAGFRGLMKRVFSLTMLLPVVKADAAAVIGPAGGSIKTPSGNSIDIPPGAVSQPYVLAVNEIPVDFFPDILPESRTIVGAVEIFPQGLIFNKPITLKMRLNNPTIPIGTIIPIVTYSPTLQKYSSEGWFGEVDDQGFVVCQEITHLSILTAILDDDLWDNKKQLALKKQVSDLLGRCVDIYNNLCIYRNNLFSFGNRDQLTAYINRSVRFSVDPWSDANAKYYPEWGIIALNSKPYDGNNPPDIQSSCIQIYHELIHYIFDIEKGLFESTPFKYTPSHDEDLAYYMELISQVDWTNLFAIELQLSKGSDCDFQRYSGYLNSFKNDATNYLAGVVLVNGMFQFRDCFLAGEGCDTDSIPSQILQLLDLLFGFNVDPEKIRRGYESGVCGTCAAPPVLVLTSISIAPATAALTVGSTQQFTATGLDQYGNPMIPQPSFKWTSSNTSIGTVDATTGLFAAISAGGPINVTASVGFLAGSASVTVTAPTPVLTSITITPGTAALTISNTQQFTATALDQFNNPMVPQPAFTWASSNTTIGTVNSTGLFSALSAGGPINVTASVGSVSGSASVTVSTPVPVLTSIGVTPSVITVAVGSIQQFTATALDQFNNPMVPQPTFTWSDSNTSIGTVDAAGLFTGVSAGGPITITASVGPLSGNASVTVIVTPPPPPPPQGVINLPQTGQTRCCNTSGTEINCAGTGQDGEIRAGVLWPNPRFTVGTGAESECITDNLTGLMWSRNGVLAGTTMNWFSAIDYANGLTLCGYSDWRLPNINELESLLNADEASSVSWLTTQGFYNLMPNPSEAYWSSTTSAYSTSYAWVVQMGDGYVGSYGEKTNYLGFGYYVLPVRSAQLGTIQLPKTGQKTNSKTGDDGDLKMGVTWPSPRFSDNGNGIVTDNLTGLMWTKNANTPGPSICAPETYKTFQGALDYVKCLNDQSYLGNTGWRLPNRKELRSLIDYGNYNPALPIDHPFTNVQPTFYWSSTNYLEPYYIYSSFYPFAWAVDIPAEGLVGGLDRNSKYPVWPVRGGQVPPPSPVCTPPQGKVTFARGYSGPQIFVVNADGTNEIRLTNDLDDEDPAWSPDGSKIAYTSNQGGNFEVYVMNADGTNQRNLTNNPAHDAAPRWSPDGTKIAFQSDRDGSIQIYVMNADGSNQMRLTNIGPRNSYPCWSPDGSKIAFESFRDGNAEIYVMNADGQ